MQQEAHRRIRAGHPVAQAVIDRQHGVQTGQRLADDAREKARGCLVRLARTHHDGRQADAHAVKEPFAGIIIQQQLADHLLRAIAGHRRGDEGVGDLVLEGRAKHRDGRGIDHARVIVGPLRPDRLEQIAGAVQIDGIALVEIGLGLARDDGGQMKDHVRAICHQPLDGGAVGNVAGDLGHLVRGRQPGRDHVERGQCIHRRAAQTALAQGGLCQPAPHHACGTDDQQLHVRTFLPRSGSSMYTLLNPRAPVVRSDHARPDCASAPRCQSAIPGIRSTGRRCFAARPDVAR